MVSAPERTGQGTEWRGLPVRLDAFEGPLDLLLYLIRREEVSIYDIPIARITEQYLAYIADLSDLDIDRAAEYLVMAATLLQIKARTLLPRPPRPEPEPEGTWEEEEDPRAELVRQLELYALYKEAARELARREAQAQRVWTRGWYPEPPGGPPPLVGVTLEDLVAAFRQVLEAESSWREVPRQEIPLREKVRQILARVRECPGGVRFHELFDRRASRLEIVVTFLALLELVRQRKVVAEQRQVFGEIWIRPAPGAQTEEADEA